MRICKGNFDSNTGEGYLYDNQSSEEHFWDVEMSWNHDICLTSQNVNKLYLQLSPTEAVGLIKALQEGLTK